jgi:glutaredoxin-like YruB-family protein
MQAVVYTTTTCPYCASVKQYLASRGVEFVERNVEQDAAAAAEMVRLSGQQGVPVTRIGDAVIVGYDRPKLDEALAQAQRPRLGAAVADAQGRSDRNEGAYVGRVRPGGAAAQAGLAVGDVVISLAGHPVRNALQLEQLVARVRPGSRAPVEYVRAGVVHRTELVF